MAGGKPPAILFEDHMGKKKRFPLLYTGCIYKPNDYQAAPSTYPAPSCIKPVGDQFTRNLGLYNQWKPHVPTDPAGKVVASVRCGGSMHDIIYENGVLSFPGHPNMARNESLAELGAKCRCLDVRNAWRQWREADLPAGLVPLFRFVRKARKNWRDKLKETLDIERNAPSYWQAAGTDALQHAFAVSVLADALDTVNEEQLKQHFIVLSPYLTARQFFRDEEGSGSFWQCEFTRDGAAIITNDTAQRAAARRANRAATVGFGRTMSVRVLAHQAAAAIPKDLEDKSTPGWSTKLERYNVGLKPGWRHKVFDAGLSVIQGNFVLDALTSHDLMWYKHLPPRDKAILPATVAWWLPYGEEPVCAPGEHIVLTLRRISDRIHVWPAKVSGPKDDRKLLLFGAVEEGFTKVQAAKTKSALAAYRKQRNL